MPKRLSPEATTDPAVMRLPHPARLGPTMGVFFDELERLLGAEWSPVKKELLDERIVLPEVIRRLTNEQRLPLFSQIMSTSSRMPGGTEQGGPLGMVAYMRHRLRPMPHFVLDDQLVSLLEHTDIAEDIPLSMFNLPFNRFYVELGRGRQCGCTLPNALSGNHILEGAYVEKGQHAQGEFIYLVLTGSPLGKTDAADDATLSLALPVEDLTLPIKDVVLSAYQKAHSEAAPAGLALSPLEWTKDALKAVLLLAKALLYIGMPGTRRELHPERVAAMKALANVKSTAKRAKAMRRAEKTYDYILISAQPDHESAAGGLHHTGGVKAHWRRGHYRMQPHGPQSSLRKLIFLQPMLIAAADVEEPSKPVTYRVT